MKLSIEIPIAFDEKLSSKEAAQFKAALQEYAESVVADRFKEGARMFGAICRYAFTAPTITVGGGCLGRQIPEELLRQWRERGEQVQIYGCKASEMSRSELMAALGFAADSYTKQQEMWDRAFTSSASRPETGA